MDPTQSTVSTPPMTRSGRSSMDADDFELEEDFFSRPYVPLSNLPTPPPTKYSAEALQKKQADLELYSTADVAVLGAAIHLCNLIPLCCSWFEPDIHIVHDMLVRANLGSTTLALTACILDSLDNQFAPMWRRTVPLSSSDILHPESVQVDNVLPEVIILAALLISNKFVDDVQLSTEVAADVWGQGRWNCDQINVTEHCINEDLNYRIHPLWQEELITDALRFMQLAGVYARHNTHISIENLLPVEPSPATFEVPNITTWTL